MHKFGFLILFYFVLFKTAFANSLRNESPEQLRNYIKKYYLIAIAEMDRTGIPASIKMAQAILESRFGQSDLARLGHNHFGIKCGAYWGGKKFFAWDDESKKSCFRVFEKDEDSFIAHSNLIAQSKSESRYSFLFQYCKEDYKSWAKGLQKAGYASADNYAQQLIQLIEKYQLFHLDYLSLERPEKPEIVFDSSSVEDFTIKLPPVVIDTTLSLAQIHHDFIPFSLSDSLKKQLKTKVKIVNKLKAIVWRNSDNLEKISAKYKIKEGLLKKYNEISTTNKLSEGMLFYLQEKNKTYTGSKKFHYVLPGQDLYAIAQQYGIKINYLIRLNKLYEHDRPSAGVKIILKKQVK